MKLTFRLVLLLPRAHMDCILNSEETIIQTRLVLLLPPAYIYCILCSEEISFQTGTVITTSFYLLYFKLW